MSEIDNQKNISLKECQSRDSSVKVEGYTKGYTEGFTEGFTQGYFDGAEQGAGLICESLKIDCSGAYDYDDAVKLINLHNERQIEKIAQLEVENEDLKVKLNVVKKDYWFMINLLERYTTNIDESVADCLERMKLRKPMFEIKKEGV